MIFDAIYNILGIKKIVLITKEANRMKDDLLIFFLNK